MKFYSQFRCLTFVVASTLAFMLSSVAAAQSNAIGWGQNAINFTPPSIEKTVQVSAGSAHTVALQENGTVVAWGAGTINVGSNPNYGQSIVPPTLGACTAIAAGNYHTVVLTINGTVVAWGDNRSGQCNVPANLGPCTAIAASGYTSLVIGHTVALKADGTVVAWGDNTYGQCNVPANLGACQAIAAGAAHTVAVKANGTVVAWGINSSGQCGSANEQTGAGVNAYWTRSSLGACKAVSAGTSHTLALTTNGTVVAWGDNQYGESTVSPTLGACKAIEAGMEHTVALKEDGTVIAWGENVSGQCNVPATLGACKAISGGQAHTVALKENGIVVAWGSNTYGQSSVPTTLGVWDAVAMGYQHTVALQENGAVVAWGSNAQGQCNVPATLGACKAIAAGYQHTVALKNDGTVVVWSDNADGKCGIASEKTGTGFNAYWTKTSLGPCKAIAAGQAHTVALQENGTVVAWGNNTYGQCNVPGNLGACKAIAAGWYYTMAIKQDGTLVAWGANATGQCNVPATLGPCKAVAGSIVHTVALKENGTVVVWGDNGDGECGITSEKTGTGFNSYWTKTSLGVCNAVAAGYRHSMAIKANGAVAAWGNNDYGQCNAPAGIYTAITAYFYTSYGILDQGATPCVTQSVAQTAGVQVNTSFWRYPFAWSWPDGGVRVPGVLSNVDLGDFGSIASDCSAQAGTFISRSTSKLYVPIDCPDGSCPGLGEPAVSVTGQAKLAGTLELKIAGDFSGTTLPANLPPIAVLQAGSIDPAFNTFDVLITDPPPPAGMFATLVPESSGGGTLYTLRLFPLSGVASLTGSTSTSADGAAIATDAIDFNGDGFDDIALAMNFGASGQIQVLLNDGLGNLGGTSVLKSLPASPTSLAVGSFDGDGLRNEVTTGLADGTVRIYHSNGSSLSNGTVITLGPGVVATAVCELPGSSAVSEVAVGTTDNHVNIFNAISGGVTHTIGVVGTPGIVRTGNLDGVKGKDLATGGNAANSFNGFLAGETGFVQILVATDTDYDALTPLPVNGIPVGMQVADIDGDGLAEIVTANANPTSGAPGSPAPVFGLFRNVSGTFSGIVPIAPTGSTSGLDLALVDVNNDGTRDLVSVYKTVGTASQAALLNINTLGPGFPLSIGATTVISSDNPTLVTKANLDGNSSEDIFLVTQGSPFTLSGNSVVTPYLGALAPSVFGDLDGDGFVDGADLGLLLLDFGPCSDCSSDLDGDGVVDGADMGLLLLNFS